MGASLDPRYAIPTPPHTVPIQPGPNHDRGIHNPYGAAMLAPGAGCTYGSTPTGCLRVCRRRVEPGDSSGPSADRLRLLRLTLALVLGTEAVLAHHRRGDAGGLVPGQLEDR